MLQATAVHGRSLNGSLLTQSFKIKQINVRPSNKQKVASEHLFETIIIVTTVAQKGIRLNYYASWPRLCRGQKCSSSVYSALGLHTYHSK